MNARDPLSPVSKGRTDGPDSVAEAREALALIAGDADATAFVAAEARDHLRRAVVSACERYGLSESEAARITGVARTTVRQWRADARR